MRPALIRKSAADLRVPPNAPLGWDEARRALDGLPGGGLNIAHEAVDRHAAGARAGHVALRWLPAAGGVRDITYARAWRGCRAASPTCCARWAWRRATSVFVLCGRMPELYCARARRAEAAAPWSRRSSPPSGPEPHRHARQPRPRQGARHHRGALPSARSTKIARRRCRRSSTCCAWTRRRLRERLRRRLRRVRGGGHRGRRRLVPALHQRHHRHAEGRGARARRGGRCTTRPARWRSTCTRTTSSGAPPTRAGSPAPPTASSRRSCTA